MENWPLPNLRQFDFNPDRERRGHWKEEEFNDLYPKNKPVLTFDFPKGWGNPWPPLPDPDDNNKEYNFKTVNLNNTIKLCENKNLLGYYMSWHIVGVSFLNANGRPPRSGEELRQYNNSLPEVNRFGIHICCKTILISIISFVVIVVVLECEKLGRQFSSSKSTNLVAAFQDQKQAF